MLYALLGLLGLISFVLFLLRWQLLLPALILFLPLVGALILWSDQAPLFLLAKDLLYVLPLYVAVFLLRPQLLQGSPIPPWLTLTVVVLALVVLLQMMNPGVVSIGMAVIGAKVWLLYIPLAYVVAAAVRTPADMVRLLRVMVAIAPVPCVIGLSQWGLSEAVGYREALTDFYGDAAAGATQNFTQFDMGGTIRRIPSTFTNSASYFVFTLATLSAALALQAMDWSRTWRMATRGIIVLLVIAGLLSGMRAAFVFMPILLMIYALISGRGIGAIAGALVVVVLAFGFFYITGFDADGLAEGVATHTGRYQEADFSWVQFSYALEVSPFGQGTGTNTVAARYAAEGLTQAELTSLGGYEVQFAKTVHELGVFGLVPFMILMGGLLARVLGGTLRMVDSRFRRAHAAFGAFLVIIFLYFFKAWVIDVDPGNVFYWLYVGLLYRVAQFDRVAARAQQAAPGPGRQPLARPAPILRRDAPTSPRG